MNHLKLFENFDANLQQKVIDLVNDNSYFDVDDNDDESVTFITRQNGDVGSETTSPVDVTEAKRLQKLIADKLKLSSVIEEVDEWVYLNVSLIDKDEDLYVYVLYKHSGSLDQPGWQGFSENHSVDKLPAQINRWTKIPTEEAKKLVATLMGMPTNKHFYRGDYAEIVLNSKAMGYDWTIRKIRN